MKENLYQSPVVFDEDKHEYHLGDKELKGITPIVSWLFPGTYASIPKHIMDAAAGYGSLIHSKVELADGIGVVDHPSIQDYMELKNQHGLKTLANEYLVSDEQNIASKIDVVFDDDSLADIKTTSVVHKSMVTVQLSIYAWLYERQNPSRKVRNLYVIWLPKPQYGQSEIIELERIPSSIIEHIVEVYLAGGDPLTCIGLLPFTVDEPKGKKVAKEVPAELDELVTNLVYVEQNLKSLQADEKELKAKILKTMQERNDDKWENDEITIIRKAASTRTTVDSAKLKKSYPEIFAECSKESAVSESLTIKLI